MYAGHESEVLLSSSCGFGSGARSSLYFFLHFRDMQRSTTVFEIQPFFLTSWQLLTFICQQTGYLIYIISKSPWQPSDSAWCSLLWWDIIKVWIKMFLMPNNKRCVNFLSICSSSCNDEVLWVGDDLITRNRDKLQTELTLTSTQNYII